MKIGTVLYYLLWPLVWIFAPFRTRVNIIVICDEKVLIVKNWFGPNRWQLPGGGKRKGESVLLAARRELFEETGIKISGGLNLNHDNIRNLQYGLVYNSYFVRFKLNIMPKINPSREIKDFQWHAIDDAPLPKSVMKQLTPL